MTDSARETMESSSNQPVLWTTPERSGEAPASPAAHEEPAWDGQAGPARVQGWREFASSRQEPGAAKYLELVSHLVEECRRVVQAAEADAEEVRRSAEEYRTALVAEAHRASEAILAAAERERDGLLEAAADEVSRWLDEFEEECRRWADRIRQPPTARPGAGSPGAGPAGPPR